MEAEELIKEDKDVRFVEYIRLLMSDLFDREYWYQLSEHEVITIWRGFEASKRILNQFVSDGYMTVSAYDDDTDITYSLTERGKLLFDYACL